MELVAASIVDRWSAVVNKRVITSPLDGVITERLQHPGEMAQSGDAAGAMLKLAQVNPLNVEMVMPVSKYGQFKPGDVIVVASLNNPDLLPRSPA